jgi:glutathione S-transferase
MKLYFVPMTRSARPRWVLEELGVPYELIRLDPRKGETRTPEYLALNPCGHVPTLVDGDQVITESAAIAMHLADKFPEKGFAPPAGAPERAEYYQWILYAMATLEVPLATVFQHTVRLEESKRLPAAVELARAQFTREIAFAEQRLSGREFVVGGKMSAADVVLAAVLGWAKSLGLLSAEHPVSTEYANRLLSRPAAKRARET